MAVVEELKLDLEELKRIRGLSIRPRVIALLSSEIAVLDDQLTKAMNASVDTATSPLIPAVSVSQPAASAFNYVTIGSFSWDQDNEKIKIYIFLDDLKEEKVDVSFKPMSVDVKFHDVQGKNHRCVIPKLNKEIVPEKCKILVKPTKVIITLCKASKGHWPDLHFKEDKLKPSLDKEKDPMAGIMGLMKNMYDEGDEDMKRTIAKAWTDARSGKTADPSKGFGM